MAGSHPLGDEQSSQQGRFLRGDCAGHCNMNLSFDAAVARGYSGPTQKIRNLSEHWAGREIYCVNCDCLRLIRFANNSRAADLYCTDCSEQYELKSAQRPFGRMVGDGAYSAMIQRVSEATGPNLRCCVTMHPH